jgi:hypothetical protein
MVAILEILFLTVCGVLGLWWFSRTSLFRAHRRSGADPGRLPHQKGAEEGGGFSPDLPSHKFPRPGS